MKKIILRLSAVIMILGFVTASCLVAVFVYADKNIDYTLDEQLFERAKGETVTTYYAYDKNGVEVEVWKKLSGVKKEWVSIDDVSDYLIDGFISMEDRKFYTHCGINMKRTFAAAINYLFKRSDRFGASTITQQVIKNISGDNDYSVKRKLNEIFRAINLEKIYSKREIMELYLNIVPMSDNIYGVSIASEKYYGKECADLTLSEAATIVGITNAPTKYNPYSNPKQCVEKRNRVLYAMYQNSCITEEEYNNALDEPLNLIDNNDDNYGISPWFIETANRDIITDLSSKYGLTNQASALMLNGAKVYLTMSPEIQNVLDEYFSDLSNFSEKTKNGLNYSMVVSDHKSGNLLGIVGNCGKKEAEKIYNYAETNIIPASTLKPLTIYAPLIDDGKIKWSSFFDDAPMEYMGDDGVAYPKNSPDVYEGLIDVNYALMRSKNTVAIQLYRLSDKRKIFNILKNEFGIDTICEKMERRDGRVLTDVAEAPLALGQLTQGISLRKLTECYNVFPNNGVMSIGKSYLNVISSSGDVILKNESTDKYIFKPSTAQIMNQMLMNVVSDGTARQVTLKNYVDTAGKTGTSSMDTDRIFVGYTPYCTAGIWCGYSKGSISIGPNVPGHLKIWDDIMIRVHNELFLDKYSDQILDFDTGETVLSKYCSESGMRITDKCITDSQENLKYGYFDRYNLPKEYCKNHE